MDVKNRLDLQKVDKNKMRKIYESVIISINNQKKTSNK